MRARLRPLAEQVIVVTGASSGIGLATARLAARRGARLVLAARNEAALRELAAEIHDAGGEAAVVAADVGREEDVHRIAEEARTRFGGFDTWVNDAAVSVYGELDRISTEDHRRLFDTNFWGVVYGSLAAVDELRRRGGGVLVNVGSLESELAFPLQAMYAASKHAVKGFTDALRVELQAKGDPVHVTLLEPGTIDTPLTRHAKSYLGNEPRNPGPAYTPEVVARAILHCAEHPRREVVVGGSARGLLALARRWPRLGDRLLASVVPRRAHAGPPVAADRRDALYEAGTGGETRGSHDGVVLRHSAYTAAALRPGVTTLLVAGAGAALVAGVVAPRARKLLTAYAVWRKLRRAGALAPRLALAGRRGR